MTDVSQLITDHLDIWTSAIEKKSGVGRGSGGGISLYGIKKLRDLVLELAVQGKLVPQDPADGDISALLMDLEKERQDLLKQKKLKKQMALPDITEDEKPYQIPGSWAFIRLGDLTNYGATDKAEADEVDDDTWVLELEDVEKESSRLLQRVTFLDRRFKSSKNRFSKGDVVYGKLRPYLDKVIVADCDGVCTTEMMPVRAHCCVSPEYLRLVLKSPSFIKYADDSTHGMNLPRLGTEKARMAVVPLPLTAEQHRIVAKVDELMRLCDMLEAQAEGSLKAHQTLVETCLAALTNSQTPEDLAQNWARLEGNFDALFTTDESIKSLRETILEWAVRGLLSKTFEADTDPNEFLQNNLVARSQLQRETGDARLKKCANTLFEEYRAPLPAGWSSASFDELFLFIDYRGRTPNKTENGTPLITAKNVRMGQLNREPREYVSNSTYVEWMTRGFPRIGDLFFTTEAPLANVCINDIDEPFALAQRVICLQPISQINTKYLELAIRSKPVQEMIDRNGTGMTAKGIKASKLKPLAIPFPPIEEQDRIVDKVQQLDAICASLASSLKQAEETKLNLADGLVRQASEIAA